VKQLRLKDRIWVHWQGRLYSLPLELRKARSRDEEEEELVAPFSCKILKVNVRPGQTLKKGEPVVVVEAMKMEYSYASPRDGVVDEVCVQEGQVVPGGTKFVRWREG
jgi:3-methylcrotonyl-CoA carboxylase alpha subunit